MNDIKSMEAKIPSFKQKLTRMHNGHAREMRLCLAGERRFVDFARASQTLWRWGCYEKQDDGSRYGRTVLTESGKQLLAAFEAQIKPFPGQK